MNMTDTPRDKYMLDPAYKALVDMIEHMIHRAEFSPSEIREATMLACINYEMHTLRSYHIKITPEMNERLDELHTWVDGAKTRGLG